MLNTARHVWSSQLRPTSSSVVQIDRIDPLYFAHSSRIDLKEETRIKATSDEASAWVKENESPNGIILIVLILRQKYWYIQQAAPPNFISDIFYLTVAMSHFGYLRTISNFEELSKHTEDMQRHLDILNGDGSWMGVSCSSSAGHYNFTDTIHEQTPFQARTEAAINQVKVKFKPCCISWMIVDGLL